MKKEPVARRGDDLRPEYDLSKLRGVRGKYYSSAIAATNLVPIEPDLAGLFPDSPSVNRALRAVAEAARNMGPKKRQTSAASKNLLTRASLAKRKPSAS